MYHICTTAGVIRVNLYTHSTNILSVSITCVGKNTALPQVGKETSDWRVQPWILSPPSYLPQSNHVCTRRLFYFVTPWKLSPPSYLLPSNHVCTRGLLYFVQPWKLSPSRYLPPPNHVCTCCLLLFVQLEELSLWRYLLPVNIAFTFIFYSTSRKKFFWNSFERRYICCFTVST